MDSNLGEDVFSYETNSSRMNDETSGEQPRLDPTFKQVLEAFLSPLSLNLQTEVEIGRLPRKMDALVTITTEKEQQQIRKQTPFAHFKSQNQIEFKGLNDRLTSWDYNRILGRGHFYIAEQKVPPHEMTITIISAGKPRNVLKYNQPPHIFKPLENGYYINEGCPQTTIIVINELAITPENYPLLIFASRKITFRQALQQMLVDKAYTYISYAYRVRPQLTHEVLAMEGITSIPRENLEFIAQDIGTDLLEFISPDIQLDRIPVEYQLERIPIEDQLARMSLEERLTGIDLEERRKLFEMLRDEGLS